MSQVRSGQVVEVNAPSHNTDDQRPHHCFCFWATVCKTVRGDRVALCYRSVVCPVSRISNVGVLWPNSRMDQDENWHAGRPRPWPHCVRWGPRSPSTKGAQPPIFGPYLLWPNGLMDLDRKVSLDPSYIVLDGDPAPLPKKGAEPLNFRPMFIVAKRLHGSGCHLVRR